MLKATIYSRKRSRTNMAGSQRRKAALVSGVCCCLKVLARTASAFTPTAAFSARTSCWAMRGRAESVRSRASRDCRMNPEDGDRTIGGILEINARSAWDWFMFGLAPQTRPPSRTNMFQSRKRRVHRARRTAIASTTVGPDVSQAVDAEFSDVGSRRRDGEVYAADVTAKERARGERRCGGGGAGESGNGGSRRLPLPFFDVETVGLKGRWEEMGGNYLLRPPNGQAPKALLHFLGGAFVGAAPHLTYNYLLSGLAEMGFLIVATPYPLGFDYLTVCDGILDRFEQAAVPLAAEYGALPVVGIGHSCGALLQLLITCLFPDTPRAANALISFNNKPVQEAVPGFEDLILPLVSQVLKEGESKSTLLSTLEMLRETVDNLVDGAVESRFVPAFLEAEVVPLVRQVLQITDQLPGLFQQIADGTREFTPTPEETRDVVSKMYRARRTIMIRFENDSIDESEGMKDVIQEGKTLLRMRRPMVDMELRYEIITGSHITPLTQNVFINTPIDSIDPLYGVRQSMKKEFLKTVNHLGQMLVDWLEESTPPNPPASTAAAEGLPLIAVGQVDPASRL